MTMLQGEPQSHLFYLRRHGVLFILWLPGTIVLILCKTNRWISGPLRAPWRDYTSHRASTRPRILPPWGKQSSRERPRLQARSRSFQTDFTHTLPLFGSPPTTHSKRKRGRGGTSTSTRTFRSLKRRRRAHHGGKRV